MHRDDQFRQWAKAVWEEMQSIGKGTYVDANGFTHDMLAVEVEGAYVNILARAGYDLVEHAIETADYSGIAKWLQGKNIPLYHTVVHSIPDLPELPEEKAE